MDFLSTLAISMGASWVSGINLYATVATLGLLGRFTSVKLPGELDVFTSWWVIGVALFLFVVEFVADKIQVVDSIWDVIHTFIRIPAGAIIAATAFGEFDRKIRGGCSSAGLALVHARDQGRHARCNKCQPDLLTLSPACWRIFL
jgi:hypothetical protein